MRTHLQVLDKRINEVPSLIQHLRSNTTCCTFLFISLWFIVEARMEEASMELENLLNKCKIVKTSPLELKTITIFLSQCTSLKKKYNCTFILITIGISLYLLLPFAPDNRCSINLPDSIRKVFRPPVTCKFCEDVTQVQKVGKISSDEFEKRFAYSGIPVVVTDATSNWTSLTTFDYSYFKNIYDRAKHKQKVLSCQFFPYKSGFKNLYEALRNPPEYYENSSKSWYFGWSNCNPETAEELRQHYGRPYFLPETSENNAVDWIFIGSPGLGAHMHVDNVRLPSWQAQLSGRKKWILMPPPECYFVCNRVEITIEEGDIIILDTNKWYHQTLVLPGKISITIGAEYD